MEHTILKMCEVLGVSTSGYYDYVERLEREKADREAFNRHLDAFYFTFMIIIGFTAARAFLESFVTGTILKSLKKKVSNRMRELDLYATPPKKVVYTTDSDHTQPTFPNQLNREFEPEAPNQVWATDITYIHTGEGFLYLNPVVDLHSRRVISYRMDDHMGHELCLDALKEAIALRQPKDGWIHHSDKGAQYCSSAYLNTLKEAGATISMSRKATPMITPVWKVFWFFKERVFV